MLLHEIEEHNHKFKDLIDAGLELPWSQSAEGGQRQTRFFEKQAREATRVKEAQALEAKMDQIIALAARVSKSVGLKRPLYVIVRTMNLSNCGLSVWVDCDRTLNYRFDDKGHINLKKMEAKLREIAERNKSCENQKAATEAAQAAAKATMSPELIKRIGDVMVGQDVTVALASEDRYRATYIKGSYSGPGRRWSQYTQSVFNRPLTIPQIEQLLAIYESFNAQKEMFWEEIFK